MSHKCYSCDKIFNLSDLSYECKCYNKGDIKYRGICISCKVIPYDQWITKPDLNNHHFEKVHQYPPEALEYWKMVNEKAPGYNGYSVGDGYYEFYYYEGPNGETGKEFQEWIKNNEFEYYSKTSTFRRSVKLPPPPDVKCSCCK